ncbi:DUF2336 domain-containing protein [Sphingomonas parva]|uniref:DUF2336 domain-containing protein n=1 Tax=Sphingomonas parva TaxID=2555898 RepID=A0A4Y8ZNA6_9SPHN|nr:DUF2336 domain-containing protein [Sphingomonas parva]TFI56752.1 DUF2336 domain-containing protein [Sphingomonas parva]
MSDLRPNASELDGAAQLLASAHARVAAAAADLAIVSELRLSERQRATLGTLLPKLLRAIEDELRAELATAFGDEALRAALSSAHLEIAGPILARARASTDLPLVAALLRRSDEHRLHRSGVPAEKTLLIDLAGDHDAGIAAEAMGLLIAQSARFDPFQEPLLIRSDLPAELEHHLVWTVAAALRHYVVMRHQMPASETDGKIAAAAARLLAGYDEGATLEAHCLRLAGALDRSGRLDDPLALRALTEAGLPLFLAVLAVRTRLAPSAVWEILSARGGRGAALLLRAAGIAREQAGAILLALAADEAALVPLLDFFDGLSAADAEALLTLWRADPAYRAAVARLAS